VPTPNFVLKWVKMLEKFPKCLKQHLESNGKNTSFCVVFTFRSEVTYVEDTEHSVGLKTSKTDEDEK